MPALTHRRDLEAHEERWNVYYGDVRVGKIGLRAGVPNDVDQSGWSCGFYPGCHPGECTDGSAPTFDQARVEFEDAWAVFLSNRTEADFQEWRRQRDFTERKYGMWKAGERCPSQKPNTMMRCPCGESFDSHRLEHTVIHVPHITAAQRANEVRH
jgi:hypothetical protein